MSLHLAVMRELRPGTDNEEVFRAKDPRGRVVVCTRERWLLHVLQNHPRMKGWEDEAKATIENPLFIAQARRYKSRQIYYKLSVGDARYLKVIVAFDDKEEGTLWTAFFTDQGRPGETWIWPASKD